MSFDSESFRCVKMMLIDICKEGSAEGTTELFDAVKIVFLRNLKELFLRDSVVVALPLSLQHCCTVVLPND